ncbi:MAG: DUF1566 domain-containing protein [Verrucomicrobia bacterium]|nr:DUF1566 domain-containing protein [Verrucomicrobiota bacterium]
MASALYWTSTTCADDTNRAYAVYMDNGIVSEGLKASQKNCAWAVRNDP